MADCVANAPGGAIHVLLSDREAEHIPGCNMAFRKERLEAIGGFDPQFRTAGDDVDLCWRILKQNWSLAFNPAAVVWHHRRNSFRAYWRQQKGYGRAEALLQQKWPEKYNLFGHLSWNGHIYGKGLINGFGLRRGRIYHGSWGRAPFQSIYARKAGLLDSLPLMPEWYIVNLALLLLSSLGLVWKPMLFTLPLVGFTAGIPFFYVVKMAEGASFAGEPLPPLKHWKMRMVTTFLHMVQPLARLLGRLQHGLTPWRLQNGRAFAFPGWKKFAIWREQWQACHEILETVERDLKKHCVFLRRGEDFDRWDLEVQGGLLGRVQLTTVVEEHGSGRQLIRFILKPRFNWGCMVLLTVFGILAIGAGMNRVWMATAFCGAVAFLIALRAFLECGSATAALLAGIKKANGY